MNSNQQDDSSPLDDGSDEPRPEKESSGRPNSADPTVVGKRMGDLESTPRDDTASPSSSRLIGHRLGDFQVMRKLGHGGMADVYAARQLSLGRDVAVKILRTDFSKDKDYVRRFRREARAAARLSHENIVQVYDVGNIEDVHYIAQELIDGENLRERLSTVGSLEPGEAIDTLVAVASALDAAAEVGITHRDIKPENVMRSSRGKIKVADFGLARVGVDGDSDATRANLTQAGLTMGTPRYMSPEQVQGKVVDVRSDLYSLGVTMYHLLAGRAPFDADEPLALAVKHLHETPEPLDVVRGKSDVPEWLVAVISRLMNKLPQDRFQSPQELLDAVASQTSGSQGTYTTIGTAAATIRLQRATADSTRKRRRKWLTLLAACLLPVVCLIGAGWIAAQNPVASVDQLLKPDEVPVADSVQEQYWLAMTRDDPNSWLAVSDHFPPKESNLHRDYFAKSMLQLARNFASSRDYRKADETLNKVLDDPLVDKRYKLVALCKRCLVLDKVGPPGLLSRTKRELESLHGDLKESNPATVEYFYQVVPASERLFLQPTSTPDSDSPPLSSVFHAFVAAMRLV